MQQFFAEPSWITESEILIRGADLSYEKCTSHESGRRYMRSIIVRGLIYAAA